MDLVPTLLHGLSDGLLLSGIMVGTWEFGEFLCPWLGRWGSGLAAIVAPWGLTVAGFSHMHIPWDAYAIGITAVWLWEPWDIAAGATLSFVFSWETSRGMFGSSLPPLIGAMVLLLLTVLAVAVRQWLQKFSLRFLGIMYSLDFGVALLLGIAFSDLDYRSDLIRFVVLGVFIGIYSGFRNYRTLVQKSLKMRATRDALTDALNRFGLEQWLKQLSNGQTGAVFTMDLDDFKPFNDIWGHATGDAVLVATTNRLRSVSRPKDALVRLGGDEFALWVANISEDQAREIAKGIHATVTKDPIVLSQASLPIQMSLGWAYGLLDKATAELADQALLHAKRRGKNQIAGVSDSNYPDKHIKNSLNWWLNQSVARLWSTWDTAAALSDPDGQIVATNSAFNHLAAQIPLPLVGNSFDLHDGSHDFSQERPWSKLLLNEQPNGSQLWAIQDVHPILDDHSQVQGYWMQVIPQNERVSSFSYVLHGLDKIAISTVFQPIVELETGKVIGFEALSRPRIEDKAVSPEKMFSIAEWIHKVPHFDRLCLEALVNQLDEIGNWPDDITLFVNVRSETLVETTELTSIMHSLENILPLERIVWELSELSPPHMQNEVTTSITENFLNLNWALDDWGSGWHPLKIYQRVKPRWIKVDRSWVQSAMTDEPTLKLLLVLVKWAREHGALTVAEGVETEAEARRVTEWGFYAGQGYFWGQPKPWNLTKEQQETLV